MSRYVQVRGWIEVDHRQRGVVEEIIADARHGLYSGGWGFPTLPFNWTLYVFFGGDLRESYLVWLRDQVGRIAGLPPVDDDNDRPIGLFVLTNEEREVTAWEIRDGEVHDRAAADLAWTSRT
ncbi:MAG: hypothetical protein L0Y54_12055 [Sporichthyaceae bacterium]|nr:hypothetical protein [Sporichthyaceae bacterium]